MAVSVQDLLDFLKAQAETEIRGRPFKVFANQNVNKLSDVYVSIDPRYNAVVVEVRVTGTNPSATITVEGSSQIGSSDTVVLPDANATQLAVTTNKAFECTVGFPYVRVRIAAISGTFADGTGFTVYVTPYRAGGVAAVTITATANENVTQIGSINVRTPGVTGAFAIGGLAAADSAIVGNPILIEGRDTDASTGRVPTVTAFHNTDDQALGGTAYGLNTGGVAQLRNARNNIDRQRAATIDQQTSQGMASGSVGLAQEVLTTTTTTVAAGAGVTPIVMTVTRSTGFQVGGTVGLEPGTVRYEQATITAIPSSTQVTIAFLTGGALFTHTQPYTLQTFLYNLERDFAGEGPTPVGLGAAIATEFESNSGGAPLTSGLPSGLTLDADRNFQGKNYAQMAITTTVAADANLVFTGNPWTSGLVVGQSILLSVGNNGAGVEEVTVSKDNLPATGAGPTTVKLVNPVVNSSSTVATFDIFGLGGPGNAGATVIGVEDSLIYVFDPAATDPKRPLRPWLGDAGVARVRLYDGGGNPVGTSRGTLTNRSGTIAAGGTQQTLAAANSTRNYLFVENPSNQTESIWINFTTVAVTSQPSIEILPGQAFVMETGFISTELVSCIATTTGHPFIAKEG